MLHNPTTMAVIRGNKHREFGSVSWRLSATVLVALVGVTLVNGSAVRAVAQSYSVNTKNAIRCILPHTRMNNAPFQDAVQYLRDTTGANIFVNWASLEAAGVLKTTPIDLNLRYVSAEELVKLMLAQVSPQTPLISYVHDNVLTITTVAQANQQRVTRVYDIQDLIMTIPNFTNFPQFNLQSATQNTNTSVSSGSAGSANTQGNPFSGTSSGSSTPTSTPATRAKAIVRLIEHTIHPSLWTAGGGQCSITYFRGQLVVSAPVYVQQLIGGR
ncbi:MAG: hypothetical protein HKL95_02495 [Phycisphaerae bacterium]|nr:hypothetical protein [Phycisphaerae bacterium]